MTEIEVSTPKEAGYYKLVRQEVVPLLSPRPSRVLDIGCGAGATVAYLKEKGLCDWAGGLEPISPIHMQDRIDQAWQCSIETALAQNLLPSADAILCLDVLEHLIDPWAVVRHLSNLLPVGGAIIASIPNIRHYKLVLDLLFNGKFEYQPSGILDSTHLRFFTKGTAVELFEQAGLTVTLVQAMPVLKPWKNKWILNKLVGGRMADLYPITFLIRAEKAG